METIDDVLAHYGVKGMRWGVRRKDRNDELWRQRYKEAKAEKKQANANFRTAKAVAKGEKQWEKSTKNPKKYMEMHNRSALVMNEIEIPRINNKPQYRNADLTQDSPLRRAYYKEFEETYMRVANDQARVVYGTNPSQNKRLQLVNEGDRIVGKIVDIEEARHADDDLELRIKTNSKMHILDMELAGPLEHGEEFVEAFLEHYGVKGMRWGVRRTDEQLAKARTTETKVKQNTPLRGAQDVKVKARAGQGVVKTKGGKRAQASEDAIRTRASRQKARKSTTDSLSNAELKQVVDRMNLESQCRNLSKKEPKSKRGLDFVKDFFRDYGDELVKVATS